MNGRSATTKTAVRYTAAACAFITALVLTGCGASPTPSASSSGGTIKLGVIESLSGNLTAIGASQLDGYRAAAAYINSQGGIGGKQITLDALDDTNDPAQGVTQVKKLISDKVQAVLGPVSSPVTNAIAPIIQAQKIPNIVGSVVLDSQIDKLPYTVAFALPAAAEAPALMDYTKKNNITKVGFISFDSPTATNWLTAWKNIGGTSVDTEIVDLKGTDFTANASRIKASGAQMVFLLVGGTQTGIVLTNLQSVGFTGRIGSYQGILSLPVPTLTKLAGADMVNKVFATGPAGQTLGVALPPGDPRIAQNQLFLQWFTKTVGSSPSLPGFSSLAWDSLNLLADAAKNNPNALSSGVAWNDALHSLNGVTLANATYTITPRTVYPLTNKDTIYLKVSNGAWVASSAD
jgi:ABC-type branched-subunit amino acid transport system substrate-binding protein